MRQSLTPAFSEGRGAAETIAQCRGLMLMASTGKSKTIQPCHATVSLNVDVIFASGNVRVTAKTTTP
jgi:hypothetical protein